MTAEPEDADGAKRRDRYQRALAVGAGAGAGAVVAGPVGAVGGAVLGPLLEPLVEKIWEEVSGDGRRRAMEVLASAAEAAGRPVEEITGLSRASEQTRLLAGTAMSAATRTAWGAKVRTLGRSLASGLLATDDAQVDVEQLIIAAISDIEGPHLALLDLLVSSEPDITVRGANARPAIAPQRRKWTIRQITMVRPKLGAVVPSLLGTLQRHGLIKENNNVAEAIQRYSNELATEAAREAGRTTNAGVRARPAVPRLAPNTAQRLTPQRSWSPTELGDQVVGRFREAGADAPDVWTSPGEAGVPGAV
jgi:hypothetical protein